MELAGFWVKALRTMKAQWVINGRLPTAAFFGVYVQQHRLAQTSNTIEGGFDILAMVAIDGAKIAEAKVLKKITELTNRWAAASAFSATFSNESPQGKRLSTFRKR